MRALVVFESMFGNTETIARAVAEGLATRLPVDVVEAGAAPTTIDGEVTLLVVGAPTHAFSMSRASTRQDAGRQAAGQPLVSQGDGLREWLEALTRPGAVAAAAVDTKVDKPRVPGSAAHAAQKRLRRLGFAKAAAPETFFVSGTPGPLVDGETERARRWGADLAAGHAAASATQRGRHWV